MKVNIIIHFLFIVPFLSIGQNQTSSFKKLSLNEGLSQTSVNCILKDSKGYMWFGTEDGLNKYDGSNFTVFRHNPTDKESLSSSYINTIIEKEDGFLWIGTKNGLNYFDPNRQKFIQYLNDPLNPESLIDNYINTLQLSMEGHLIIGTSNGLNIYKPKTGFLKYRPQGYSKKYNVVSIVPDEEGFFWVLSTELLEKIKIQNNSVSKVQFQKYFKNSIKYTMLLDSLNLWIGSDKGLIKFNIKNNTNNTIKIYNDGSLNNKNNILSIAKSHNGKLWLGSLGGGLINFDKTSHEFQTILHDPSNRLSLNSSSIRSIFLDESDILWLGTFGGGINKYDPEQFKFKNYRHQPGNKKGLSENSVRSILLDKDGELWVGTHNGLNRIDPINGLSNVYQYNEHNPSTISSNIIRSLYEDSNGIIWAGSWENGLNRFDKRTGKFKRYTSLPFRSETLGPVRSIASDKKGNIWIGGNGLWNFNPLTKQHKSYFNNDSNKTSNYYSIQSVFFDKNGLLWIGTQQNGLYSLDTQLNKIKKYLHNPTDTLSISNNHITSIAEDKNSSLWIGTYGGGLNRLDVSSGIFHRYNVTNGLLNNVIYGVLIDNKGLIWFSSNAGLGRFDPNVEVFNYFGVDNGIQSDEFNAGAYFKSKEGELFFGGINGLNSFKPDAINRKKETSRIVFTDFQLLDDNNTSVNNVLEKHISRAEHIKLNYNQNTFTLKFAELNFSDNTDNNYEYQLEGFEIKWNNLGKKQIITIGNLKPGEYSLNIRVRNDLTKKSSIKISIFSPLWQSNWAYLLYTLIVITVITLIYKNLRHIKRIRKEFELNIQNWEKNKKIFIEQPNNKHIQSNIASLKNVETTSKNQRFLERVIKIVEDHMDDSTFDVNQFADEMFMSRSQLHRKLKPITGYSTTEFIRFIRLKRAAQLLSGNAGTVSEIAYKVGFDNIGYFSKCFKETFGKPPSQYDK